MSIRQLFLACGLAAALPLQAQVAAPPAAAAAPAATPAPAAGPAARLSLAQALAAARDNLDVAIARGGLAAARADILAADHAPLPVLSTSAENVDLKNGIGAGNLIRKRIDKKVGIDWTIERGGKRELRTAAATRAADAAAADVEDVRVQQLIASLSAYYDLLAAQERQVQVDAIERSATELSTASGRRVQAGDLPAQDAMRVEIETQRARADVQQALLDRQRAAIALAQSIGARGAAVEANLQAEDAWPVLPAVDTPTADYASLAENRPDVRAALARAQAAQANLDGALALKKSDVTVGAGYEHYPGVSTRLVEVRASIPLQWGYGYEGEIGRAQASYYQAQDALDKARRDGALELQGLQQAALTAERRARGYETDILPRARRVAENAELAYRRGAIPLFDLLDARRVLRATLLEAVAARADYAKTAGAWTLQTRPDLLTGAR
ncbi:TolC family protein [uncultured Xylophilus sp.]|uniref:TolC family protein n=1 Tax=uncultured Xylophilus sp. TaxID=296832 RepID=UPI0025F8E4E4|nr:TolC family protein [uncultured Xylophilus sp.]